MRRDWNKLDPVEYFNSHYSHIKRRGQLDKEDNGLYTKLRRTGKLNKVLPEKQRRNYNETHSVELFHEKYFYITSRAQLRKEDQGLYQKLLRTGKLDKLLLNKNEEYRDYSQTEPTELFYEKYSHVTSREQLHREDNGLLVKLRKLGKLDEVLPLKKPRKQQRDYNQTDPVELFHKKYSHVTSRTQLEKEDVGLYKKLGELGKLDEVLPEKLRRDYNQTDPLKVFYKNYLHITSRKQLIIEDPGLYSKLFRTGKLDEVLPSTNSIKRQALEKVIESM